MLVTFLVPKSEVEDLCDQRGGGTFVCSYPKVFLEKKKFGLKPLKGFFLQNMQRPRGADIISKLNTILCSINIHCNLLSHCRTGSDGGYGSIIKYACVLFFVFFWWMDFFSSPLQPKVVAVQPTTFGWIFLPQFCKKKTKFILSGLAILNLKKILLLVTKLLFQSIFGSRKADLRAMIRNRSYQIKNAGRSKIANPFSIPHLSDGVFYNPLLFSIKSLGLLIWVQLLFEIIPAPSPQGLNVLHAPGLQSYICPVY